MVGQFSRCGYCFFCGGEGGIKVKERGGVVDPKWRSCFFFSDDLVESLLFLVVILPQLPFDKEACCTPCLCDPTADLPKCCKMVGNPSF